MTQPTQSLEYSRLNMLAVDYEVETGKEVRLVLTGGPDGPKFEIIAEGVERRRFSTGEEATRDALIQLGVLSE